MPNIVSLFSGCGGLDLGFEQGDITQSGLMTSDMKHVNLLEIILGM